MTQGSYHVNPETGKTGLCRAQIKCDFKLSPEEHFATEKEARDAYEARQSGKTFSAATTRKTREKLQVSQEEAVEIDTRLNEIITVKAPPIEYGIDSTVKRMRRMFSDKSLLTATDEEVVIYARSNVADIKDYYNQQMLQRDLASYDENFAKLQKLKEEVADINDKFERAGGWNRAWITSGVGAHVHKSQDCSTCNKMGKLTDFGLVADFSKHDEDEIVEAAGYRACTVCYPSAPVGATASSHPTKMFTADEVEKKKAREEREAKRAAANQKKLAGALTADGSPFEINYTVKTSQWEGGKFKENIEVERAESFKTEKAAVMWYTERYTYHTRGNKMDEIEATRDIERAIAEKHGKSIEEVREELEKKVNAKRKREGRVPTIIERLDWENPT